MAITISKPGTACQIPTLADAYRAAVADVQAYLLDIGSWTVGFVMGAVTLLAVGVQFHG